MRSASISAPRSKSMLVSWVTSIMKKREMLGVARRELSHIPAGPFHQQLLRQAFWNMRLNSLGRSPQEPNDPLEVVNRAVAGCMEQQPATYEFDRAFFEEESRRLAAQKGGPPEAYGAKLTIVLAEWARHFPPDWMDQLAASLATIHQTIWERRPTVTPEGPRRARVELDTYGFSQTDASHHAETLLRRHMPLAGLLDGDYSISVTSAERPTPRRGHG